MPETLDIFADNLSMLRKQQQLTQAELAEAVGLSRCSIIYYESKRKSPSLKNLQRFAQFFNVSVSDLLEKPDAVMTKNQQNLITQLQLQVDQLDLLPPKQQRKISDFIKNALSLA